MKKLLLTIGILIITIISYAQQNFKVIKVGGNTEIINSTLASGDEVYDMSTTKTWRITSYVPAGENLNTIIDKVEIGGGTGGGIEEAPNDGKQYGRQSESWTEVTGGSGGSGGSSIMPKVSDWVTAGTTAGRGTQLQDSLDFYSPPHLWWDISTQFDDATFTNCVIQVEKGSKFSSSGTVTSSGSSFQADHNDKIFYLGQADNFAGTWYIDEVKAGWFGMEADTNEISLQQAAYFCSLTTGNTLVLNGEIVFNGEPDDLYVSDGFTLKGNNAKVHAQYTYASNSAAISIFPIDAYGQPGSWIREGASWFPISTTTNATIDQYDSFIPLTSTAGIEVGSLICIFRTGTDRDFYEVYEVDAGGVWTSTHVIRDYASGEIVYVNIIVDDITVKDIDIYTHDNSETALLVGYANKPTIQNVKVINDSVLQTSSRLNGIWLYRSWNFLVNNCRTNYATYGIFTAYGGLGVVSNCIGDNAWHCFENTQGSKHMQFSNCIGTNSKTVFRFHHQCNDAVITDCQMLGAMGISFAGRDLIINGGIIRGNTWSIARFGDDWASNEGLFNISGTDLTGVNNNIVINDLIVEGGSQETDTPAGLIKVSGSESQRTIQWNNCTFRLETKNGQYGYSTAGSKLEEFNNCTFEVYDQTQNPLFSMDHYNSFGYNPEIRFNNTKFYNVPDEGIYLKYSQYSMASNVDFIGGGFYGDGETDTDLIVARGHATGAALSTIRMEDVTIDVDDVGYIINAYYYKPDISLKNNTVKTNINNYFVSLESTNTFDYLGGNRFEYSDALYNPAYSPTITHSDTYLSENITTEGDWTFRKDVQGLYNGFSINNSNSQDGAKSQILIQNDDVSATEDALRLTTIGIATTTAGGFKQDGAVIASGNNLSGGLNLISRHATAGDIRMYVGGYDQLAVTVDATDKSLTSVGNVKVPDDAYASDWNTSVEVPTKNAVYDKLESVALLASTVTANINVVVTDIISPADGTIWINSTDATFNIRINGVTYSINLTVK